MTKKDATSQKNEKRSYELGYLLNITTLYPKFLFLKYGVKTFGLNERNLHTCSKLLYCVALCDCVLYRAVGMSENLGVPVLFGGHNLPPLNEIGLTDLPKPGSAMAPLAPSGTTGLLMNFLIG